MTYRFRAVLPSDPDFPYTAGKSGEVHVRVCPALSRAGRAPA